MGGKPMRGAPPMGGAPMRGAPPMGKEAYAEHRREGETRWEEVPMPRLLANGRTTDARSTAGRRSTDVTQYRRREEHRCEGR